MSFVDSLKVFFGFQEEGDIQDEGNDLQVVRTELPKTKAKAPATKGFRGALINGTTSQRVCSKEIKIEEPRIYEDSLNIATTLRENKPVIVNLKHLDSSTGKRLIDFVCGTAYAINGHMVKIGDNIFLFTPEEMQIVDSEDRDEFDTGARRPGLSASSNTTKPTLSNVGVGMGEQTSRFHLQDVG
ncbi:cell division protein SepF [bacterium]|jgi:cell division inhibitor SepF|nr:cell division protein SepF [bacterium]